MHGDKKERINDVWPFIDVDAFPGACCEFLVHTLKKVFRLLSMYAPLNDIKVWYHWLLSMYAPLNGIKVWYHWLLSMYAPLNNIKVWYHWQYCEDICLF